MIPARGWASIAVAAGWLGLIVACHTEFRFDDHSVEAGGVAPTIDAQEAPPEAAAACQTTRCGYDEESCSAASCELQCPHNGNCTGLCGANCTGDCEEDSQCTLTTGSRARLQCEARAHCLFTFGGDSESQCEGTSRCDIVCLGTCSLFCHKGAKCAFACSANDPLVTFTGRASCP